MYDGPTVQPLASDIDHLGSRSFPRRAIDHQLVNHSFSPSDAHPSNDLGDDLEHDSDDNWPQWVSYDFPAKILLTLVSFLLFLRLPPLWMVEITCGPGEVRRLETEQLLTTNRLHSLSNYVEIKSDSATPTEIFLFDDECPTHNLQSSSASWLVNLQGSIGHSSIGHSIEGGSVVNISLSLGQGRCGVSICRAKDMFFDPYGFSTRRCLVHYSADHEMGIQNYSYTVPDAEEYSVVFVYDGTFTSGEASVSFTNLREVYTVGSLPPVCLSRTRRSCSLSNRQVKENKCLLLRSRESEVLVSVQRHVSLLYIGLLSLLPVVLLGSASTFLAHCRSTSDSQNRADLANLASEQAPLRLHEISSSTKLSLHSLRSDEDVESLLEQQMGISKTSRAPKAMSR